MAHLKKLPKGNIWLPVGDANLQEAELGCHIADLVIREASSKAGKLRQPKTVAAPCPL